jgi:hypothetical protein
VAGSSNRDISGIEGAETETAAEGDRADYCTCAVRGIFGAEMPWLLPWPTPRLQISSLAGLHGGQTRRAGLVDMEVCTAASRVRICSPSVVLRA